MAARTATIERKTNETQISVSINLDCQAGSGNKQEITVSTGIGFLDHVGTHPIPLHHLLKRFGDPDVYRSRQTLWHVIDHEVPGRPVDRRPPHCRYVFKTDLGV